MLFNKKYHIDNMERFNNAFASNNQLKDELNELAMKKNEISKEAYCEELLEIFKREGLELSLKELEMLLKLRSKNN